MKLECQHLIKKQELEFQEERETLNKQMREEINELELKMME